jgi:hypothetical protein
VRRSSGIGAVKVVTRSSLLNAAVARLGVLVDLRGQVIGVDRPRADGDQARDSLPEHGQSAKTITR